MIGGLPESVRLLLPLPYGGLRDDALRSGPCFQIGKRYPLLGQSMANMVDTLPRSVVAGIASPERLRVRIVDRHESVNAALSYNSRVGTAPLMATTASGWAYLASRDEPILSRLVAQRAEEQPKLRKSAKPAFSKGTDSLPPRGRDRELGSDRTRTDHSGGAGRLACNRFDLRALPFGDRLRPAGVDHQKETRAGSEKDCQ